MRRIILLLSFLFLCSFLKAQDCPTGGVTIGSQAQADDFITLYPNCTEINGSLFFQATEPEVDVTAGFANIKKVNGDISAIACQVLGAFTALDTLMGDISAGVDIGIDNSYVAGRMRSSFPNLKYISGSLKAYDNEAYPSVSCSFPVLTRIGGGFGQCLSTINCLDCINLEYIGGNIYSPIGGLNDVDTIMGTIDYRACSYNTTFIGAPTAGFNELKYLGGSLMLGGDEYEVFGDVTGFQQLNTIVGELSFDGGYDNSDGDYEVTGLGQLKHAGSISTYYYNLRNLDFLSQLESVDGDLSVYSSNKLTDINGLNHAISIGGELTISNNGLLSECAVQAVCEHLSSNKPATIANNMLGCNDITEVDEACQVFLPIEMTDPLRAYLKNKTAVLEWRTSTEVDNAGFDIQRSKDGIQWEKIGWQVGQDNTSTPHSYTYTDRNPLSGISYYRLKQVDTNGDTTYSNVVSLQYIHNSVTVYPNPVKEQLYLDTKESFVQKITIHNTLGSQVTEIINPGTDIDVSTLPKGIYILKITVDDEDFYEKIIVE